MMLYSVRMRAEGPGGIHISGAEGLFEESRIKQAAASYKKRALSHPRGRPARIIITVEPLDSTPEKARALDVRTIACKDDATDVIRRTLAGLGISARAISAALRVVRAKRVMRGAALIDAQSGRRLEPQRSRGVRVTRLGYAQAALRSLSRKLALRGINSPRVREALAIATKISLSAYVVAELCVSDDPDYTTGYISSRSTGYVRITNIKPGGLMSGGRVLFVQSGADIKALTDFLEHRAVLISTAPASVGPPASAQVCRDKSIRRE